MKREVIETNQAPAAIGPYVQGVRMENMLFTSGQLGIDVSTGKLEEGIARQTHMCMKNIGHILRKVGASYKNVVKATIFLQDLADFAEVNTIYGSYFEGDYPTRSCVEVASLPLNALVEIETISMLEVD
ncbi:MAG: RidA family protein [Fastidiosipilaceae bacterium]|jgi:2-iminobutanoate/2-iminopropanoate deaminase